MENGTDEAKAVSKYLLPSVYEEGVAQLLEALTEAQGDFDSDVVQAVLKRTL
jgi:HAD-superfamily hydrolase, subfamily IIB